METKNEAQTYTIRSLLRGWVGHSYGGKGSSKGCSEKGFSRELHSEDRCLFARVTFVSVFGFMLPHLRCFYIREIDLNCDGGGQQT